MVLICHAGSIQTSPRAPTPPKIPKIPKMGQNLLKSPKIWQILIKS